MKKLILTTAVFVLTFIGYAQKNEGLSLNKLKYVVTAPDGSVAMTITDHENKDLLELESVANFYQYEVLDQNTSEPVLSSENKGNTCVIDKNELKAGLYNLRLYTANFIITSELSITPTIAMRKALMTTGTSVASRS